MSDLPTQGLLQQMHARSVPGDHLEVLGKRAAALWSEGRAPNLNDAVVAAVKTAGLSPEQVRRVVEFTNTAAYLSEFAKEGAAHHVVDFGSAGPANPATVLQDLNDGGGGSTYDTGNHDYNSPPTRSKTASAWEETVFEQMFHTSGGEYPEVNPLGDVIELRDKLGSAYEEATSMLSSLEVDYDELSSKVYGHVKQAAMNGHALSEITEIWRQAAPTDDYVKVAFAMVMPRLVDEGVFHNHVEVADSLMKYAQVGMVDPSHPLVLDFQEFCGVLEKLAHAREAQQELGEGASRLTAFLKEALDGKSLVDHAGDFLHAAGEKGTQAGQWAGKKIFGEGSKAVEHMGTAGGVAAKYVAPALAANEVYRRGLKYNPVFNHAQNIIVGSTPGTDRYRQLDAERQARAQGY